MLPSVTSRLKKNLARTKEKILYGIGKSDRTNDENFDCLVMNFEVQLSLANKLNRELNKYLNCLRETQKCSKTFFDTLKEIYEVNWPESDLYYDRIHLIEVAWVEYLDKLANDVQIPLASYLNEFPDYKKKIEKRYNRLLDYDNARHSLQSVQNKAGKNQFDINTNTKRASISTSESLTLSTDFTTKVVRLKNEYEDKEQKYEEINKILIRKLPLFFEKRITVYSVILEAIFNHESKFHSLCFQKESELRNLCKYLPDKFSEEKIKSEGRPYHEISDGSKSYLDFISCTIDNNSNNVKSKSDAKIANKNLNSNKVDDINTTSPSEFIPLQNNTNRSILKSQIHPKTKVSESENKNQVGESNPRKKVIATFAYNAKELDELTFEKDDIIIVIDGSQSENEDLDEGWLLGIHEKTMKRGLFPENFTRKYA